MPNINALIKDTAENLDAFMESHTGQVKALERRIHDLENESARSAALGGRRGADEPVEARAHLERGEKLTAYLAREKGLACPDSEHGFGHLARALVTGAKSDYEVQALSKGTDASGGYAVPEWYAAEVIDLMRSKLAIEQAGARTVPLEGDKTHFLRIESDPVAGWRLESGQVKASDMTFGRTTFVPKSLAVIVKVTRELLEDGQNVEWSLRHAFAAAFAQELDRVALFGSGENPEPLGIVNTPGIQTYDLGASGAAVTSYAPIVRARGMMLAKNTNEPTAAIMAPRTATAFEELVDTTGQPLQRPRAIENLPFLPTTLTPVDDLLPGQDPEEDEGNASRVIVGDFSNLWIGIRTGFRIEVLREHFADTMTVAFLAHLRADIQVTHPAAFVDIPGFIPAE